MPEKISKSVGVTSTEQYLSKLCDRTFLKLWSYPNPFRERGKELCDLIAVFENHVFLFFDRETKALMGEVDNFLLAWERWRKEAVTKQIRSAKKARNHILKNRNQIYLDASCTVPFPVKLPEGDLEVHTIIVAHGASEACKNFSEDNVSGSLAIIYRDAKDESNNLPQIPFVIELDKSEPAHLLDSHTVDIILGELDTFYDFMSYIRAKEAAIERIESLSYVGEEDLLAHYYLNFDKKKKEHFIGTKDNSYNFVMIGEGEWNDFIASDAYKRKKEADKDSYLWDELLQRTAQNALDGTLLGDAGVFESQSAIFEMAKEPRFMRRELAKAMRNAINNFPDSQEIMTRHICVMPSFSRNTPYVFLQLRYIGDDDYESQYRPKRRAILEIACGVARNKFSHLSKVVGIAIDAPKFAKFNSEDFILLNCADWSDEQREHYNENNKHFRFFESKNLKSQIKTVYNFPIHGKRAKNLKIGRNDPCPCGSGKKSKKCHCLFGVQT
ncbi:uncharacterized protein YchJ [Rhodoblastus acidophilus]|uniref:SEC-C metal-binding domain-containing protein n=1 Tax=Rhodoblastus acidophilus TaxID=1074 RepID=UPI002224933B|nr:SEC-C metal-binding domain-containing protein [Rhodoblastus acidophilus]MCW2285185.1 uncharacterized protein YchJ [Rhodoblastus acidophilus]MCW2334141.1 uncharacterized protein YchJ [Rhodoblastus acidophilus]